ACALPIFQAGGVGGTQNQPGGGDGTHQMVKLGLDGVQIREDISVIVFQIVQDGRAGAVVNKFGALVEKGGVVFVGLDHKQGLFWIEAGRHTQAGGHATDQEVGGQLGLLQDPAQHGAGGGLAVRAGHGQNVLL